MIKVNKSAVNRLAKVILNKPLSRIRTKEIRPFNKAFGGGRINWIHSDLPVYLVPIRQIRRMQDHSAYSKMRLGQWPGEKELVNHYRKMIRRREVLKPVVLSKEDGYYKLHDGHHRLTAHQAEGIKFIRAVFPNDS